MASKPPKKAIIRNGQIIYGDDIAADVHIPADTMARERRQAMKVKYRKDLLQPNQVDYYRAYPDKKNDLPDETKRLLS